MTDISYSPAADTSGELLGRVAVVAAGLTEVPLYELSTTETTGGERHFELRAVKNSFALPEPAAGAVVASASSSSFAYPASFMVWIKPTDVTKGSRRCVFEVQETATLTKLQLFAESPHSGTGTQADSSVRFRLRVVTGTHAVAVVDWKPARVVAADH